MRLCFFDFNINYGGAPQGTVYLAERLAANNEVHIIDAYGSCEPYCRAIRQADIPLHVLHPNAKWVYIGGQGNCFSRIFNTLKQLPELLHVRKRLVEKVLDVNPDVIWVNSEKSLFFLASSPRLRKYPIVIYFRGWATPDQVGKHLQWLMKHRVKAVIAHARATISQLQSLGIPQDKLHFTPNAIDISKVQRLAEEPLERPLPGMDKRPRVLLPAARPTPDKGHLTAVRALARIVADGYDPVLWLPGQVATGGDLNYPKQVEKTADELNLKERVHFIGWREDMERVINASDIVILPTYTEGFPRVILEAMVLRRPVCATPVGGIPEAIIDGETGLLFPVDDDKMLARQIERLLTDSVLRDKIVEQAYEYVLKGFTPDEHTRIVTEVFESVVGTNKQSTSRAEVLR